jgi:ABC-type multidrug transport system fused ATPase/permease subunit
MLMPAGVQAAPFVIEAAHMVGRKIILLMVGCVLAGLILGAIEVVFGIALVNVLAHYSLITAELPQGLAAVVSAIPASPAATLVFLSVAIFFVRGSVAALPGIVTETLHHRIRSAVAHVSLSDDNDGARLSVADTSHLLVDLLPKSAGFIASLTHGVSALILALAILAGVIALSATMTLITLGVGTVMLMPLLVAKRLDRRLAQAFFTATETFSTRVIRAIRNAVLLKISGTADRERETLIAASRSAERSFLTYIMVQAVQGGMPLLAGVFVVIALLEAHVRYDIFSIAELVPFVYLLSRLAGAASGLITTISGLRYSKAFFARFVALREQIFFTPTPPHSGRKVGKLQQLDTLNLHVGRDRLIVSDITFHLRGGEMLLISGPSGRGKTTLLMTLTGLVGRHGGQVMWNGVDMRDLDLWSLRERIGYAGADPYLLDASIEDNLLFGKSPASVSEPDMNSALTCACADFVYRLSGGLKHVLKEGGEGISAGQKQRIAIARALLRKPDILILDEATGNVDIGTEAEIVGNIRRDFPELMIIAVSHRESLEKFATSVLHL